MPQTTPLRHRGDERATARPAATRKTRPAHEAAAGEDHVELELKFDVAEAEAWRLLDGLTPIGRPSHRTQRTVYFDTPDALLRRHGFVLRIRDDGVSRTQTIKARTPGAGFRRHEWETPVAGLEPDLKACARTPLAALWTKKDRKALTPVFEVRVKRARRLVAFGGARVEIVFDHGEVRRGTAVAPIRELELELKSGDPRALFDLARDLCAQARLDLSFTSKADRGYALVDPGLASGAGRDRMIDAEARAADAFRVVAMTALDQMATASRQFRTHPDATALHQLRVATRRLRGAVSLFGEMLDDDRRDAVKAGLKWLSGELNDARNLDVFIADGFAPVTRLRGGAPGLDGLGLALAARRERAYDRAAAAVGSATFRSLMLDTALWVDFGDWSQNPAPRRTKARQRPAADMASALLAGQYRKLARKAGRLARLTPPARHALRIKAKTLRYAAEFFSSLYTGQKAKAHERALRRVTGLQNALGRLNDIATAGAIAPGLAAASGPESDLGSDPWRLYAVGLVIGERWAAEPHALRMARKAAKRLIAHDPRSWKT